MSSLARSVQKAVRTVLFYTLTAAPAMTSAAEPGGQWQAYEWTPGPAVRSELMSPAVEITVYHDHFDDKPAVPYSPGLMINRHIRPGQSVKEFDRITRDSKGQDEEPTGTHLPLALYPKGADGFGGEWLPKDPAQDRRTRHQQMWDYFEGHLAKAYDLYKACKVEQQSRYVMYGPHPSNWNKDLSDWEKFHAICRYASAWQSRQRSPHASQHPMDVMFYGYHCGGVHQIFLALFHVAGFETRALIWPAHSSTEVKIGGKWVFADMMIREGGNDRSCHSWAEISAEPDLIKPAVLSYIREPVARRAMYCYEASHYWQFMGPDPQRKEQLKTGLGLPYTPSTATALYPELRLHLFHVPEGEKPSVTICRKGSWATTKVALDRGQAIRKMFYISDCRDNPAIGAIAKFFVADGIVASGYACTLDGRALSGATTGKGTLEFRIPAELLTPGEHELIVRKTDDSPNGFVFYPDIQRPYHKPIAEAE